MVDNGDNITLSNCKLVEGYLNAIDVIVRKLVETTFEYDSIECTTPISYVGNMSIIKKIKSNVKTVFFQSLLVIWFQQY